MPQPEAPAARSGANHGAAYSESASNVASMPTPARSLYPKLAFFISLLGPITWFESPLVSLSNHGPAWSTGERRGATSLCGGRGGVPHNMTGEWVGRITPVRK